MYSFETIDLGSHRGDDYLLVGFVEPDPSDEADYDPDGDAENYGVTLARTSSHPLEGNVQIVRMDTSHGRPHVDLLYVPPGSDCERKIWLDTGYSYRRMKRYLLANWRTFAEYESDPGR